MDKKKVDYIKWNGDLPVLKWLLYCISAQLIDFPSHSSSRSAFVMLWVPGMQIYPTIMKLEPQELN